MTTVDELVVRLLHAPRVLVVEDKAAELGAMLRQNYGCHVDETDSERRVGTLLITEKYDYCEQLKSGQVSAAGSAC